MTSLNVGDLAELRAGTARLGTVLGVVECRPRRLISSESRKQSA
jgi:hypothetical protein